MLPLLDSWRRPEEKIWRTAARKARDAESSLRSVSGSACGEAELSPVMFAGIARDNLQEAAGLVFGGEDYASAVPDGPGVIQRRPWLFTCRLLLLVALSR